MDNDYKREQTRRIMRELQARTRVSVFETISGYWDIYGHDYKEFEDKLIELQEEAIASLASLIDAKTN